MPQVIFAPAALQDLQRLREFLRPKNPAAAKRAATNIVTAIQSLARHPQIGRPIEAPEGIEAEGINHRELLIGFGDSGYVALYRLEGELVTVLALRHQKETGYAL